jgi:hypothetical protein
MYKWLPLVLCAAALSAAAEDVTLQWDLPSSLTGIDGYEIHHGDASGAYTAVQDVPGAATTQTSITGVDRPEYFAARSRNADSTEFSGFSNEVVLVAQQVAQQMPDNILALRLVRGPGGSAPTPSLISQAGWSLLYVDSEELTGEADAAINSFDGDPDTFWHTHWTGGADPLPHEIQIDLGATYNIAGFRYLPRQEPDSYHGIVAEYEFYVSTDGSNWGAAVANGTFADNNLEKEVQFSATNGRYIRFRGLSEIPLSDTNTFTSAAEINVLAIE